MALSASFSSPLRSHTTNATYASIRSPLLPNAAAAAAVLANPSWSREEEGTKCVVISHREPQKWRTSVSFFSSLTSKGRDKGREALKYELMEAIEPLDRGADASPEDQERIDQIACALEAVNQAKEPLKSNLLNGRWELLYTTSGSVLGTQRSKFLRPNGNIYQAINADTLRAQNMETWPFFNQIPIKAPGRGRGELEITYLDDEIRISRGDKGNLFILKMVDPSYKVPLS